MVISSFAESVEASQAVTGVTSQETALVETIIDIITPLDGAKLNARVPNPLDYNVTLAGDDDHIFVYIDGVKTQKLRRMQGSYTLEFIPLGKHEICIKVAYKDDMLTGQQRCITATFLNLGRLY
jgi:hypothetical protein